MTKPHDPLFRNTRENRVNIRDDICSFSYSLFCAVFYNVWCGRPVIGVVFLVVTSVVRISLLDFFFVNFVHIFRYHFCSPLLVSVFLTLLIFFLLFTHSINRKFNFVSCFIQLTKLHVINGLVGHGLLGYHFPSFLRKLRSEFLKILKPAMKI